MNEVNRNDKTLLEVYQKGYKGISKNAPFPLQWRGIKGEAKQIIRVFRDAYKLQCFFYRQKISIPTIRAGDKYPF